MNLVGPSIMCCVLLAGTAALAQLKDAAQDQHQPKSHDSHSVKSDRGQQVFNQNCSRCHSTPEGFSPRISASVARHMRVRAGLGDEDYKALLKFLNP
jgi:cytochrome c5